MKQNLKKRDPFTFATLPSEEPSLCQYSGLTRFRFRTDPFLTSFLINTARGPIVDEAALVETLRGRKIAGAAIDVFEQEPLPAEHPFRHLPNLLATPHIAYGSRSLYEIFYGDFIANISSWIRRNAP